MTLDPQARVLLDQLAAQNPPPTETLSPREARLLMEVSAMALRPLPEVGRVEDIAVPGAAGSIRCRVSTPAAPGPSPALVFFHGGGWVTGSLATHDHLCRSITRDASAVVVSVDYRLAPEHPYPAAVDDSEGATRWVSAHFRELGIDPERISLGGDSAGGNLAAAVALRLRDRRGPAIASQFLLYPATDAAMDTPSYRANAEGFMLTRDAMAWYWSHYAPEPATRLTADVSPARASDLSGLPPALVVTAGYDPLRDEAESYAERLRGAGVPVRLTRYAGMVHGFVRRYPVLDMGRLALRELTETLRTGTITTGSGFVG